MHVKIKLYILELEIKVAFTIKTMECERNLNAYYFKLLFNRVIERVKLHHCGNVFTETTRHFHGTIGRPRFMKQISNTAVTRNKVSENKEHTKTLKFLWLYNESIGFIFCQVILWNVMVNPPFNWLSNGVSIGCGILFSTLSRIHISVCYYYYFSVSNATV